MFLARGFGDDILFTYHGCVTGQCLQLQGPKGMSNTTAAELDFIEELRMRRWAREHYVPRDRREASWHPVVLEEMDKRDGETSDMDAVTTSA